MSFNIYLYLGEINPLSMNCMYWNSNSKEYFFKELFGDFFCLRYKVKERP